MLLLALLFVVEVLTMPSPCSLDLRERVVATVLSGELSHAKIARLFSVSESSLHRWLREYRATGDLTPKPHAGGHGPLLSAEGEELLASIIERANDRTLDEYCLLLEEAGGPRLARSTMYDAIERLEITRKKKRSTQPRGTGRTSSRHEASSRKR